MPTECWSEAWQTCLGINTSFLLALLALLALLVLLALLALWRVSGIVSESGRLHALLAGVSL